jgi:BirA family transcriptional regulator, biotin operon repressor / biotin---[acetyl-CoA-carboxylase] ligase
VRITTSAAVAVCQTIETISPLRPEIKWVNDILADGRKVCGISCEAVSDFESGMVEYVIVGMGINFKTTVFPDELNGIAGGLFSPDEPVTRNRFAAMAVSRLLSLAADMNNPDIIREYRRLSAVIGRPVKFCEKNVWYEAEALDVDENGGLVVREADGRVRTLVSGEITLRVRK